MVNHLPRDWDKADWFVLPWVFLPVYLEERNGICPQHYLTVTAQWHVSALSLLVCASVQCLASLQGPMDPIPCLGCSSILWPDPFLPREYLPYISNSMWPLGSMIPEDWSASKDHQRRHSVHQPFLYSMWPGPPFCWAMDPHFPQFPLLSYVLAETLPVSIFLFK